jgi:uncharacterized protein YeeX (DUF496 family)
MSLLSEILDWSIDIPPWQRDALRRLFQYEDLTENDYDALYAMLKTEHGIPDPHNHKSVPLAPEHLPSNTTEDRAVLKSMQDLKHVNRINSEKPLTFSKTGITIIYGGNGSGKSGYSRVLKQACRARDQTEDVLTDATNAEEQTSIPEAVFDIETQKESKSLRWHRGNNSPDELSTIAVFDAHCARAYLKEGEAAYLPYGMDIVVDLADVIIPNLKKKLSKEISSVNVDVSPFNHLCDETEVGKLISDLNHETDTEKIKKLATLSETETARIAQLKTVLSESDPKAKAQECRLSAERIKDFAQKTREACSWVNDESVAKLQVLCIAVNKAEQAERLAAQDLRSDENLLPGTGEKVWKTLFEAARKFSTEVAYPGKPFPYTEDDALCPLCQQSLGEAGNRLKRFEEYIQNDTAQKATNKKRELDSSKAKLQNADIDIRLSPALREELESLYLKVVPAISNFQKTLENRRKCILTAMASNRWAGLPDIAESPNQLLRHVAAKQLMAARNFKKAANELNKQTLKKECDELVAREKLKTSLAPILRLVEKMKFKNKLKRCEDDLNTRKITDKCKDLAKDVITPELKKAIENEFSLLHIEHIKTKLEQRNEKGKVYYSLILDLPTDAKLGAILSEGEQRALAISSFFAELELANHKGAIVLDDPVCSLDHYRREYVARRIIKEAKHRQVIVFTHDTIFLAELQNEMNHQKVNCLIHHLEWIDGKAGYVQNGLPWEHKGYKERLDLLKKIHKRIEKKWQPYPNSKQRIEIEDAYNKLRATIERVIEDIVFNDVIKRYREHVKVGKLDQIADLNIDHCNKLKDLYKRCHPEINSHDKSSAKHTPPPTPNELKEDITILKTTIQEIKDERTTTK